MVTRPRETADRLCETADKPKNMVTMSIKTADKPKNMATISKNIYLLAL